MNQYYLVELVSGQRVKGSEGISRDKLYAARDFLQQDSLDAGYTLLQCRYAVAIEVV